MSPHKQVDSSRHGGTGITSTRRRFLNRPITRRVPHKSRSMPLSRPRDCGNYHPNDDATRNLPPGTARRTVAEQAAAVGLPLKSGPAGSSPSLPLDSHAQTALSFAQTRLAADVQQHLAVAAKMLDRSNSLPSAPTASRWPTPFEASPPPSPRSSPTSPPRPTRSTRPSTARSLPTRVLGSTPSHSGPDSTSPVTSSISPSESPHPASSNSFEIGTGVRLYTFAAAPSEVSLETARAGATRGRGTRDEGRGKEQAKQSRACHCRVPRPPSRVPRQGPIVLADPSASRPTLPPPWRR